MSQNSNIKIDPSVLQNRSVTYSSLTDVNGADLFTDKYEQKVEAYDVQREEAYSSAAEHIFVLQMQEYADLEERVKMQLFTEDSGQIIRETSGRNDGNERVALPVIAILLLMGILAILRYLKNRKGKWEKDVDHAYDYE